MDRMLYIAMSAAKETMLSQAVNSHNLANATTTGFRASLDAFTSLPVSGPGYDSRTYAVTEDQRVDLTPGAKMATGRDLDVAVQGKGWIAVQAPDGTEGYTRAGDLRIDSLGLLTNGAGHQVLGNAGPIAIPPYESLEIAHDGTISVRPLGQEPQTLAVIDRIRLVDPPADVLMRGEDGLVRRGDGLASEPDAGVTLVGGILESSNVNAIDAMVNMIRLARNFETQVKLMRTAEENSRTSARLLQLGS